MVDGVRRELVERIASVETKLSSQIHDVTADIARIGVLVEEEQNARNSVVLEALHLGLERQDRF
jgi:hypothetical protein